MLGCCIQIYTYRIHTTHHHGIKTLLKLCLIHIMLILTYTDALWVNLYQFGKRVHQSSSDAHGTTNGNILIRELISRNLRSRIDRSTILAHHIDIHRVWITYFVQPIAGFTTCRTITHSHCLNLIHLHHALDGSGSLILLVTWRMRKYYFVMNQITLRIETTGFTAIGEPRIHSHHTLLS